MRQVAGSTEISAVRGSAMRRAQAGQGFTLIELLVVISIISLLMAILLPALGKARQASLSVQCKSQMRQIGIGTEMYFNDYKEWFPLYEWYYPHNPRNFGRVGAIGEYIGHTRENREKPSLASCRAAMAQAMPGNNYLPTIGMNSYLGTGYEDAHVTDIVTGATNPADPWSWTVNRRLSIRKPSSVMIYLDSYPDAPIAAGGMYYLPNFAQTRVHLLSYPHLKSINLTYVDGHVDSKNPEDMLRIGSMGPDGTNAWKHVFWGAIYSKDRRHKDWPL